MKINFKVKDKNDKVRCSPDENIILKSNYDVKDNSICIWKHLVLPGWQSWCKFQMFTDTYK